MQMFLEIPLIIVAVVILVYLFFYYAPILMAPAPMQYSLGSVCFGKNCFQVELAKTPSQIEKGLMFRKELDKDKGMLFIFSEERIYPFWMKNTLIPLDMIWINANNKVVFISQNVQPCKSLICPQIAPAKKEKYVLELNAGLVEKYQIKIGDPVDLEIRN